MLSEVKRRMNMLSLETLHIYRTITVLLFFLLLGINSENSTAVLRPDTLLNTTLHAERLLETPSPPTPQHRLSPATVPPTNPPLFLTSSLPLASSGQITTTSTVPFSPPSIPPPPRPGTPPQPASPIFLQYNPFPFKTFFNSTISDLELHYGCSRRLGRFVDYGPYPLCCDCTEDCWKYKTCCIDKLWNEYQLPPLTIEQYVKNFEDKSNTYKATSCEKVLPLGNHETETIDMVVACPRDSIENLRQKCVLGTDEQFPVLGDDEYVYKNMFCALCNHITRFEYLNISAACVAVNRTLKELTFEELDQQTECIISVERNSIQKPGIRTCLQRNIENSNCSAEDKRLCRLYQASTHDGLNVNPHCLKCSQTKQFISQDQLKCPSRCKVDKWCYLPNERDLSKYSHRLHLTPSKGYMKVKKYIQKFPIWEFFGVSNEFEFEREKGFEQYLCSGRRKRCCSCYEGCTGDWCCVDTFWNETNPVNLETYKRSLVEKVDKAEKYSCLPVYPKAVTLGHRTKNSAMIRICPYGSSPEDQNLCTNIDRDESLAASLPVKGDDGRLYANSFCAKCNSVEKFEFVNISADCTTYEVNSPSSPDSNLTHNSFKNLKSRATKCIFGIPGTSWCEERRIPVPAGCIPSHPDYFLCRSYSAKINNFQNYHCMKCALQDTGNFLTQLNYCDKKVCKVWENDCNKGIDVVKPTLPGHTPRPLYTNKPQLSWSLLLSFSRRASGGQEPTTTICPDHQLYDTFESKCVPFRCPPNYVIIDGGGKCVRRKPLLTIGDEDKPIVETRGLTTAKTDRSFPFNNLTEFFISNFKYALYVIQPKTFNASSVQHNAPSIIPKITLEHFVEDNSRIVYRTLNTSTLQIFEQLQFNANPNTSFVLAPYFDERLVSKNHGLDFSRVFPEHRTCAKPKIVSIDEILFNKNTVSKTMSYRNQSLHPSNLTLWISKRSSNDSFQEYFSVCEGFYLTKPCFRKTLNSSDIINITDNLKLITKSHIQYTFNEYIPTSDGYETCVANNKNTSSISKDNDRYYIIRQIEFYITVIGTPLSIVCYIWIITTYFIFKDLRTVPGLNNCLMCLSLLFSDIFFLSTLKAHEDKTSCTTVAVAMHWSLLSAFFWVLIISYDLVKRFGSFTSNSRDRELKRMSYRSAMAFGIPLVIVSIALGLDTSGDVAVGYGENHVCWITNLNARIVLYIVPTALVILIALFTLSFTVFNIIKQKRRTQSKLDHSTAKKTKTLDYLKMAIKLALILGLTEIFGYVQLTNIEDSQSKERTNVVFAFVYSVFRSLRGVMLWFVYVGGPLSKRYQKRVVRSLRKYSHKNRMRTLDTQTSAETSYGGSSSASSEF
ncbi:uncharacterized protein [Clytia hemisphaerica]